LEAPDSAKSCSGCVGWFDILFLIVDCSVASILRPRAPVAAGPPKCPLRTCFSPGFHENMSLLLQDSILVRIVVRGGLQHKKSQQTGESAPPSSSYQHRLTKTRPAACGFLAALFSCPASFTEFTLLILMFSLCSPAVSCALLASPRWVSACCPPFFPPLPTPVFFDCSFPPSHPRITKSFFPFFRHSPHRPFPNFLPCLPFTTHNFSFSGAPLLTTRPLSIKDAAC